MSSLFLYRNEGAGRFISKGCTSPLTPRSFAGGGNAVAGRVDVDNDGRLDVFAKTGTPPQDEPDLLFRNRDEGQFVEMTNAVTRRSVSSMSSAWGDFNRDGRPDLFLPNLGAGFLGRANPFELRPQIELAMKEINARRLARP